MLRSAISIKRPVGYLCRNVQVPRLALPFSTTHIASQSTRSTCLIIGAKISSLRTTTQQRLFSTSAKEQEPSDSSETSIPPDAWVSILENTVSSPWLYSRPGTPERILQRSFTLLLQIILALNIPREPDAARAFFFTFENAPVSSTSDMGRGRRAIGILTRTVIDDISSIPINSPLRQQHLQIFALHNALVPLCDMHLRDPSDNIEDWKAFWSRAEGPLMELNTELDNAGFGLDLEKILAAQEEEKALDKKDALKSEEGKQTQDLPNEENAKKE